MKIKNIKYGSNNIQYGAFTKICYPKFHNSTLHRNTFHNLHIRTILQNKTPTAHLGCTIIMLHGFPRVARIISTKSR